MKRHTEVWEEEASTKGRRLPHALWAQPTTTEPATGREVRVAWGAKPPTQGGSGGRSPPEKNLGFFGLFLAIFRCICLILGRERYGQEVGKIEEKVGNFQVCPYKPWVTDSDFWVRLQV